MCALRVNVTKITAEIAFNLGHFGIEGSHEPDIKKKKKTILDIFVDS